MPSNREIVYRISVRNLAREAVRQLHTDLAALGMSLKQVARQLQDVQQQTARMGQATTQADRSVSRLAASAKSLGQAAKDVAVFAKAVAQASGSTNGFQAIEKAVGGLDRAFRTSGGLGVYRARLLSLQSVLAALPAQFAAAAAAASGLSGAAPPRAPRGNGSAGAPPPSNGPPGGGAGGGNAANQNAFNQSLATTRAKIDDIHARLKQLAVVIATAFGARQVLAMADTYTQLIGQLKLVTDGSLNLTQAYDALFTSAQKNYSSVEGTVQLYSRFAKATNTLGVTQREVVEVADSVNKAIAIFGGNAQSAEAALFQFSQGLGAGALRGEELNSVMEQAPRLAQAIADGLKNDAGSIGIPIAALRTYAEQGKLTTEAIFKALQNQRGVLEFEAKTMGLTVGRAFTYAQNAMIDFVGKAGESSGASKRVAQAIIDTMDALKTPAAISAAQGVLGGFASVVSTAASVLRVLIDNLQLVVTAAVALKALSLAPTFAAMGASAGAAASSLAVYAVGTRSVVLGATAANIAVNGLNAALRAFGGPIGIAITAAAAALAYWATSTKQSVESGTQLAEVTDTLKKNYDAATNSVKNLTEAERARERLKLQGVASNLSDQSKGEVKALNDALAPGLFEGTDGSRLAQRFMPFREEIETFRKSAREGKADFDALQKAVSLRASKDTALEKSARDLLAATEAGAKYQSQNERVAASLRLVEGSAPEADAVVAGTRDTLAEAAKVDGSKALVDFIEKLRLIGAEVPQLAAVAEANGKITKAQATLEQGMRSLTAALKAGTISQAEFNDKSAEMERTMQRARDAINGVTQAQRDLRDAQRDLGLEGLVDRERVLESINIKYDRQIRAIRESAMAQADMNRLVQAQNDLRQQEIGNLDVRFRNNDLRDRVLSLQNEARLLTLTGEARERASKLLEVEAAARRAGVSNVQGMVEAYGREYDALKRAEMARQTVGTGFQRAVTNYVEGAARVADESERMFGSMFNILSDGFADTFRTGTDRFRSMLDSLASDLLRFASRQLFRTLLSSVFGDGQGGMGGQGTSFGAQIMSALGMDATKAVAGTGVGGSIAAVASGVGTTLNTAAGTAASGVVQLSSAATEAAGSFGDIPSKLSTMLKGLGATDAGVAGFLGNIQAESGFKPGVVNSSSGAYGLIQALGPRKAELFKQYGSSPTADQQIEFMRNELLTTEKASLNMLRSSSTLADGVKAGIRFERPEGYVDALRAGDLSQVPDFGKRLGYAERFGAVSSGVPSVPGLEGATLSDSTISKLNSQFDDISSGASQVNTSFSQMGNALDQSNLSIVSSANGVSTTLSNSGTQVGNALSQVSSNISKSGNDLFNALSEMASKAGGSVTKGLGGLLDIGKGWAGDGFDLGAGKLSDWMHTGGVIGRGAGVSRQADTSLWDNAPKFHTGGIVGGLKSRERAIIAQDEEAIFPTVRMSDGNFGIRATGFNEGSGAGGNTVSIGDIKITTQGSSGNAQQDADHAKMMAREVRAQVEEMVNGILIKQSRSGGMLRRA